jgi:hypothetical protein
MPQDPGRYLFVTYPCGVQGAAVAAAHPAGGAAGRSGKSATTVPFG